MDRVGHTSNMEDPERFSGTTLEFLEILASRE